MATLDVRPGMRASRRVGIVLALASAVLLGSGSLAHAGYGAEEGEGGAVDVDVEETVTDSSPGTIGAIRINVPGPWTQRVHVPYCPANLVRHTGPGVRDYVMDPADMCLGVSSCPADDDFRYWVFERRMGANNQAVDEEGGFDRGGVVCRGIDDPDESEPPTISLAQIIDAARALAPTPTFVIEPAAKSYVNVPTNFAADVEPVTVNVTLLGITVPVEFTPGDVTWNFGDGRSGSGVGVRNASVGQAGAVEHAYARSGEFDVSLSVGYSVRVIIPTGDPITLPTPITRTAAPQSLPVGEIQSVVTEVD